MNKVKTLKKKKIEILIILDYKNCFHKIILSNENLNDD